MMNMEIKRKTIIIIRLAQTGPPTPLEAVADVELSLAGSSTGELSAGTLYFDYDDDDDYDD